MAPLVSLTLDEVLSLHADQIQRYGGVFGIRDMALRTALMTDLIFPGLKGRPLDAEDDELTELVVGVASGRVSKGQTAFFLERNSRPRRK